MNCTFMFFLLNFFVCLINFFKVGNKDDSPERKVVVREDAERFARQMNVRLFETSAKENLNVEEVFNFFFILSCHIQIYYFERKFTLYFRNNLKIKSLKYVDFKKLSVLLRKVLI